MRIFLCAMVISLAILLAAAPARACFIMASFHLEDIKYASVVVIGRVVDYEIVYYKMFPEDELTQKYARFKVVVDEVLVGQPSKVVSVTWVNSTFGEPEKMEKEPYLIGLREPGSKSPWDRFPIAEILPSEPNSLTVLQASCAPAFILEATSAEAKTIRDLLGGATK